MALLTLSALEAEFGAIAMRTNDLGPVMRVGGIMGLAEIKGRFDTQVGSDGKPWPSLAMPRAQGGNIPLRNTGLLLASYTYESGIDYFRTGTNLHHARLLHYGGVVVPTNKQWLTIPLTKEAVYAGSAPAQGGLHFRKRKDSETAGLYDRDGNRHWLLKKSVKIPARPQVGISGGLMEKFKFVLVQYLRTGSL